MKAIGLEPSPEVRDAGLVERQIAAQQAYGPDPRAVHAGKAQTNLGPPRPLPASWGKPRDPLADGERTLADIIIGLQRKVVAQAEEIERLITAKIELERRLGNKDLSIDELIRDLDAERKRARSDMKEMHAHCAGLENQLRDTERSAATMRDMLDPAVLEAVRAIGDPGKPYSHLPGLPQARALSYQIRHMDQTTAIAGLKSWRDTLRTAIETAIDELAQPAVKRSVIIRTLRVALSATEPEHKLDITFAAPEYAKDSPGLPVPAVPVEERAS